MSTGGLALQSAFGLVALAVVAWLIGERRRQASARAAAVGILVQVAIAALFLKIPAAGAFFHGMNGIVLALQRATDAGAGFVFGFLGGAPLPYEETRPGATITFAFRILPLILVVSALSALLTHWRILPAIVRAFAWTFERTLGVGGAVAVSSAANVFLGMVESPLLVKPYLARLTRSELFVVMCTGMAGVAGTVLVLYATMLAGKVPDAAGHLLVASIISVPASITIARLMVPESDRPTPGEMISPIESHSAVDAIVEGTRTGLALFLTIASMLIVFVALVALANEMLGLLPAIGGAPVSLERIFGVAMAPFAWLIGIPWHEAMEAGSLLGIKVVLNELLAFVQLASLPEGALSARSNLIMTYALCGFANFGSAGILIGGMTALAPERRVEIAELGMKSIIGGMLATLMTAACVGMLEF